jgi:hypothetical protein
MAVSQACQVRSGQKLRLQKVQRGGLPSDFESGFCFLFTLWAILTLNLIICMNRSEHDYSVE